MKEKDFWKEVRDRQMRNIRSYYGVNRRTFWEGVVTILGIFVAASVDFNMRGLSSALEDFAVYAIYTGFGLVFVLATRIISARRKALFDWQSQSLDEA